MAIPLKQSTAVTVKLGPFVDAGDGATLESGLTLSQADIRLSKNGGDFAQTNNSAGATYDESGFYDVPLDTTDTNTLGNLVVVISESGALLVFARFMVLPANVYDSLFSTDRLEVDLTQIGGAAVSTSTAQLGVNAVQAGGTAWGSGAITAASLAADAGAEIADAVCDEALSGHVTSGTLGQRLQQIRANTAQAGAAGTITLDASASATDDFYNGNLIHITGGTGAGQARVISDYVGSSKVASVAENWATNPSSDSVFQIVPGGSGPVSGTVSANVVSISGDSTAADNAESFFDGTGYAGTNNTIPTVTTVTNAVTANVTQISGDSGAADNAEAFFDGTGYAGTNNVIPTVTTTTNLTNKGDGSSFTAVPWNAAWDAEVQSEVADALEVALADSIPADGSLPSLKQAMYMVVQYLTERSVSGTTVTVRKVDGSTGLYTLTLNDATTPTSTTRAT